MIYDGVVEIAPLSYMRGRGLLGKHLLLQMKCKTQQQVK